MKNYSPRLITAVNLLTTLSCIIVIGVIFSWTNITVQTNLKLIFIYMVFQVCLVLLIWFFAKSYINIKLSLFSFNTTYLLTEILLIIFFSNTPNVTQYKSSSLLNYNYIITAPLFQGNNTRGYKLVSEDKTCRNFKMTNNVIEYDVKVNVNNIGFSSHFDYQTDKPDSVKRYIVFGDSFSAGLFLDSSWVDKIQADFVKNNIPIQLYNFSIDGGGIMNWYSVFCNEVIPAYDFDGIIIMSYLENLTRQFFYVHSEKEWVIASRHNHLPPQHSFHKANKEQLYYISNDSTIKANISKIDQNTFLYTLPLLEFVLLRDNEGYSEEDHIKYLEDFIGGNDYFKGDTISDIKYIIGIDQFHYLNEILSYCNKNQKDIIFAAAPDKTALKYYKKHDFLAFNKYFELLSSYYEATYYNTYDVFSGLTEKEIKNHWFLFDFHWNQKGSNYFAKYFQPFLEEEILYSSDNCLRSDKNDAID